MQISDGPAVAGLFGLGAGATLEGPVARGLQGVVWRLHTPAGCYAVKESTAPQDEHGAAAAAVFQETARGRGIPAPRIHASVEGGWLAQLGGCAIRVYDWVDVAPADRRLHPADVGSLLARLHAVEVPLAQGPPPAWYTEPVGAARWDELVTLASAAGAPFAADLAAIRDDLVALEDLLAPATALQMCHLDLWADNLRAATGGGLCVLDWDNAGPGDPSHELAMAAFEFGLGDPARVQSLYAAYLAGGGAGRLDSPIDFAMLVAVQGHLAELHTRSWLDPAADEDDRAGAEAGLAELLGDPLTPRVVDAILAAATDVA